jgi:hypothetical protein
MSQRSVGSGGRDYVHFKYSGNVHAFAWPHIYRQRAMIFNVVLTVAEGGDLTMDDAVSLWRRMASFVEVLPKPKELTDDEVRKMLENLRNGKIVPSAPPPPEPKPADLDPEVRRQLQQLIKDEEK